MTEPNNTRNTTQKVLRIITTVFWGVPAVYVLVAEIFMIVRGLMGTLPFEYPIEVMLPNFVFLAGAVLLILAVIAQWGKNKTRKVLGNVLFLIISILLVPILMLGAAFAGAGGTFIVLLYPIAGLVLAILSLRFN